jgi:hypothetical protein
VFRLIVAALIVLSFSACLNPAALENDQQSQVTGIEMELRPNNPEFHELTLRLTKQTNITVQEKYRTLGPEPAMAFLRLQAPNGSRAFLSGYSWGTFSGLAQIQVGDENRSFAPGIFGPSPLSSDDLSTFELAPGTWRFALMGGGPLSVSVNVSWNVSREITSILTSDRAYLFTLDARTEGLLVASAAATFATKTWTLDSWATTEVMVRLHIFRGYSKICFETAAAPFCHEAIAANQPSRPFYDHRGLVGRPLTIRTEIFSENSSTAFVGLAVPGA